MGVHVRGCELFAVPVYLPIYLFSYVLILSTHCLRSPACAKRSAKIYISTLLMFTQCRVPIVYIE